ncbi:MgtC/SapB family protein [Sulfurihydrogenibium subterraneum]|uniref:MgtC/SapB family protein n=1 Tax=Sulfurihydrogenibium subterraneum TaxID=171121 RepID=UPI0004905513|nr:MgtC/SapB family protein [Sulfurihydrogenibium subterraneum]
MQEYETLYEILLSLGLGFFVGLEREYKAKGEVFAGVRTYPLISLLGYFSALVSDKHFDYFIYISFLAILGFTLFNFFLEYQKDKGITTEVSVLLIFLIGVLVYFDYYYLSVFLGFLTTLILAIKQPLENFAKSLYFEDVISLVKFLLLTAIVYPILPDKSFGPYEAINLKEIWKVVIIVAVIDFIGYILVRWKGGKSLLWVALFGGLISSTAITYNFSILSKKNPDLKNILFSGITLSWIVMNLRVLVISGFLNLELLKVLTFPLLVSSAVLILIVYRYIKLDSITDFKDSEFKNPFRILEILQFAIFYTFILLLIKYIQNKIGITGVYLVSFVSGVIDVDAITFSAASLSKSGVIFIIDASIVVILAVISNSIFKYIYVLMFAHQSLKREMLKVLIFNLVIFLLFIFFQAVL